MATERVVGYVRVSTTEQAEQGYGLDVQRQALTDWARANGYDLVHIYEDAGVRGALPLAERAGLRDALAHVRQAKDDPIPVAGVITRFNRLGRDAMESLLAEREFHRTGATVFYVDGLNGDTPELKFMRHVMHGVAELDKDMLVARLAAGRQAKAAQGGYAGGRPKIGWRSVDKELVVDEAAAKIVRGIFAHVAKGWSLRRIARFLDERRALGRTWDARRVHRIVSDPRYKAGGAGHAIVDPRLFNKANAELAKRRTRSEQATAA
jgi:site-specific DNA recombinase